MTVIDRYVGSEEVKQMRWPQGMPTAKWLDRLYEIESPDLEDIRRTIKAELIRSLPFVLIDKRQSKGRIVSAYTESLGVLFNAGNSWNLFWETLMEGAIEPRSDSAFSEVPHALKRLLELIEYRAERKPPVLCAELLATQPEALYLKLGEDLTQRINILIDQILYAIHTGLSVGILGPVNWADEETCEFVYFRHPIIELSKLETTVKTDAGIVVRDTRTFMYRFAYHHHHVMSARLSPGIPAAGVLPKRIRLVAEKVPSYLYPAIATVDGLLVAERIVEIDQEAIERHTDTPVRPPSVDPAITIGPYVLAGWSDRDFGPGKQSIARRTQSFLIKRRR